jgi:hypothetical protein
MSFFCHIRLQQLQNGQYGRILSLICQHKHLQLNYYTYIFGFIYIGNRLGWCSRFSVDFVGYAGIIQWEIQELPTSGSG